MLEFDHTIRKANGISQLAFLSSYKNQKVNVGQGKQKSVRVSGVFELPGLELSGLK